MLEVLVPSQQRLGKESCDMLKFSDIHPDIDGLSWKHGQVFEMRMCFCPVCHRLFSSHSASLPEHLVMDGEVRTCGCGLPRYTRKVVLVLQRRMKDFTHIPHLGLKV